MHTSLALGILSRKVVQDGYLVIPGFPILTSFFNLGLGIASAGNIIQGKPFRHYSNYEHSSYYFGVFTTLLTVFTIFSAEPSRY